MSQTVKINGVTYNDVKEVKIPLASDASELVRYIDTSDGDATAEQIKNGATLWEKPAAYTNIIDTIGYTDGVRLSSSGATTAASGYTTTGIIDISAYTDPVIIRVKGVDLAYSTSCYIGAYKSTGEFISCTRIKYMTENGTSWNNVVITEDVDGIQFTISTISSYAFDHYRITGYGSGANFIVTINEEIT